jgi:co-chaperonin GroES (HSP10)
MAEKLPINSSEFKPMQDFILVKALEEKEVVSDSGLIISVAVNKSVLDRPTFGTIIETGPEVKNLKIGMEIAWPMTDGLDYEFKDGMFKVFRENSIVGYKK